VPLEEEFAVIHAYLDIESLWMGSRLTKDRADHRSGLVEVSNASFLVPTAGGERGAAWNPILAKSRPAMHRGPPKPGELQDVINIRDTPKKAKFTYARLGRAAEHSTSLTSSGQSLLLASRQRGAVHRRPSLQPFLWAQQPHKPNEVREGKNKRKAEDCDGVGGSEPGTRT
jgi:hypothetical protein